MFRVVAMKELREVSIILILVGAYWVLSTGVLENVLPTTLSGRVYRNQEVMIPFVTDGFQSNLAFFCGILAIGLGLRQTLGESIHGTYLFLFHRPATRRWIIGAKLSIGIGVLSVCGVTLLMIHGIWAATPGTHASPFFWSMTIPCWMTVLQMTFLYLAAFLTGIRPGRWYGTRLFPLLAAAPLVVVVGELLPLESLWWIVIALAGDIWLLVTIFYVARTREYP